MMVIGFALLAFAMFAFRVATRQYTESCSTPEEFKATWLGKRLAISLPSGASNIFAKTMGLFQHGQSVEMDADPREFNSWLKSLPNVSIVALEPDLANGILFTSYEETNDVLTARWQTKNWGGKAGCFIASRRIHVHQWMRNENASK